MARIGGNKAKVTVGGGTNTVIWGGRIVRGRLTRRRSLVNVTPTNTGNQKFWTTDMQAQGVVELFADTAAPGVAPADGTSVAMDIDMDKDNTGVNNVSGTALLFALGQRFQSGGAAPLQRLLYEFIFTGAITENNASA